MLSQVILLDMVKHVDFNEIDKGFPRMIHIKDADMIWLKNHMKCLNNIEVSDDCRSLYWVGS